MSETKLSNIRPNNLVINGAMTFWQRGNISTAVNKYWCDRWFASNNYVGGTVVQERITDAPSVRSKYCNEMKQTVAASVVTELSFKQIFEKQFVRPFINKKVILSFYIKSNKTSLYANFSPLDGFTGGADVSREITIDVADTWEKKSFVFDMSSYIEAAGNEEDAGAVLNIGFGSTALGLGQTNLSVNDYFRISEVMITDGFEKNNFVMSGKNVGEELSFCQRYFYGIGTNFDYPVSLPCTIHNSGYQIGSTPHPVGMRVAPVISFAALSNYSVHKPGAQAEIPSSINEISSSVSWQISGGWPNSLSNIALFQGTTSDGDIRFDAEL